MNTYRGYRTRSSGATPQNQAIPGREEDMTANSAGGFSFKADLWTQLDRFLILGTEGGTFYIKEAELTKQNAKAVEKCIVLDGPRTVARIVEISEAGRAVKNEPALFALAMCFAVGSNETKALARAALPKVARIGTHIFHFAQFVEQFRGWGRSVKTAIGQWYTGEDSQRLAYQLVKYRQRDGWTHADLIRLSHPGGSDNDLYRWALRDFEKFKGFNLEDGKYRIIDGFRKIQEDGVGNTYAASLIREYRLPREAVPTQMLSDPSIWEALLEVDMGVEAMIRNLGNMAKVGLLVPFSDASKVVIERLGNAELLRRARLHPLKILTAERVYGSGKGVKGDGTWTVVPQIVDALEEAFYASFGHIEPTGKNTMLAIDVSGSMTWDQPISGIDYREAAAVMAMVTARTEPNYLFKAFSTNFSDIGITAKSTLREAIAATGRMTPAGTDCALPMVHALKDKLPIDTFVIYTDNETWAGKIHPSEAIKKYRQETGKAAKVAVVGMAGNNFTIADPKDAGMMDFVGFDVNTPAALSSFAS